MGQQKGRGGPNFRKFDLDSYENGSRLLLSLGLLFGKPHIHPHSSSSVLRQEFIWVPLFLCSH